MDCKEVSAHFYPFSVHSIMNRWCRSESGFIVRHPIAVKKKICIALLLTTSPFTALLNSLWGIVTKTKTINVPRTGYEARKETTALYPESHHSTPGGLVL